jgi:hypothetical protein
MSYLWEGRRYLLRNTLYYVKRNPEELHVEPSMVSTDQQLSADVEDLRPRFPRTQDLYREVCVLLFFRYGITPTAHKLYQLVRKGSMSAPTQALSDFWSQLRDRSRVTIEHAGLPDELRAAAGEMIATIWKSAQTMSADAVASLRDEALAAVRAAEAEAEKAKAARTDALAERDDARDQLKASLHTIEQLRQDLAAAAATRAGLEARLEDMRRQLVESQARADESNSAQLAERERLAERTQLAEQRFADSEKRALLEIDRERMAAAKLQKTLESERAAHAAASERFRTDQNNTQIVIAELRAQVSTLKKVAESLGIERDRERAELQTVREQLENAIRQAAAESARAEQMRTELERNQRDVRGRPQRGAHLSFTRKRKNKADGKGDV